MGKMTDFFQIVTPSTPTSVVQDNQLMDTGYAATSNYTWYQKLIQGSGTRLTRYNEYDVMDNDVEVSRALDIIAEEMTGRNTKTSLPIELKILDEKHANTEDTIVLTLRTACQHWCKIHGFDANRLFKLSRNMVKYGDCFFRKNSNFKKWEWIPAGAVSGAIVDSRDVTQVIGYRVRIGTKAAPGAGSINSLYRPTSDTGQYENISIDDMVVFSINDDMSDAAPFGESVLRTVYKTHKQKELLEDAIVIYRIQRAPERRVFYIDVGKMPPHRVKTYLETIKNEIRQKKIPSNNMNGQNSVDSIYNPQCLALDTLIPILDGRTLTLAEIIEEHKKGLDLWTYSINPDTGAAVPGIISWAGVTRKNTEVLRITFDNGKTLICTPDHKIPVQGKGFVEAKDLTVDDSLYQYECGDQPTIITPTRTISTASLLTEPMDVGTLTIDQEEKYHNYHTFAIDAGIYVKNSMMEDIFLAQRSDGVGSKVDVLQGGTQLGEQSDLDYFCDKVLCGLRIPKGWMGRHREDSGAVFNDGKLGAAYIEEQQFAKFVERLQVYVSAVLDYEFKLFLYSSNIQIDNTIFEISLPKPSNYEKYKQADLDSALLGTIGTADGIPWLSKRWIARNYLQMSEEQLIDNENLLKQEKGINHKDKTLQAIYGPPSEDGGMGGIGGGLGGLGGGIGGIEGGMGDDTFNIGGAGDGEGDFGELENPGEAPTPPVPSPTSPKQAPAPGATPKPV
jgi:hypothetical protein